MDNLKRIRSITAVLTADCNLSCRYCYQNTKKKKRMRWSTLKASLDLVLGSHSDKVQIIFLGGEPLLEFLMIRRAVEYVAERNPRKKRVEYHVSTNGTLLNEEIIDFLEAHSFALRISFDGAAQDVRGAGTFDRLDRLLDRLREKRADFLCRNVTICMTVTPATIAILPESIGYFLKKEVPSISIGASITAVPDWNIERIDGFDSLFGRVFASSLRYWRKTGKIPVLNFRDVYVNPPQALRNRPMCALTKGDSLTVDVDGQMYGCPVLAASYQKFAAGGLHDRWASMRMGNIHDPCFPERYAAFPEAALQTGMFDHKEDKYSSYGRCRDCRYFDVCYLCPGSIVHVPGNKDPNRVSDFCCAFNLVYLKHREQFVKQQEPKNTRHGPKGVAYEIGRWRRMAAAAKSAGRKEELH